MIHAKIVIALSLILLAQTAQAESRPPAPEDRVYFTIVLGLDDEQPAATCLEFGRTEVCSDEGLCGPWKWTSEHARNRRQAAFSFDLALVDDEGTQIRVDGVGRLDSRGSGHSIAAVARARSGDDRVNFGMVGRPIDGSRCAERAKEFNRLVEGFAD